MGSSHQRTAKQFRDSHCRYQLLTLITAPTLIQDCHVSASKDAAGSWTLHNVSSVKALHLQPADLDLVLPLLQFKLPQVVGRYRAL